MGNCFGSFSEKKDVWDEINEVRRNTTIKAWCVVDDFNSISYVGKRRRQCSNVHYNREVRCFNKFFEDTGLVDILLVDRKFGINRT